MADREEQIQSHEQEIEEMKQSQKKLGEEERLSRSVEEERLKLDVMALSSRTKLAECIYINQSVLGKDEHGFVLFELVSFSQMINLRQQLDERDKQMQEHEHAMTKMREEKEILERKQAEDDQNHQVAVSGSGRSRK